MIKVIYPSDLKKEGDYYLSRFFDLSRKIIPNYLQAKVDEKYEKFIVKAEVPGLSEENVQIEFNDKYLNIEASYKEDDIREGKWSWSYYFEDVEDEKITASIDKGVLTVELPKKEKAIPKKIKIG